MSLSSTTRNEDGILCECRICCIEPLGGECLSSGHSDVKNVLVCICSISTEVEVVIARRKNLSPPQRTILRRQILGARKQTGDVFRAGYEHGPRGEVSTSTSSTARRATTSSSAAKAKNKHLNRFELILSFIESVKASNPTKTAEEHRQLLAPVVYPDLLRGQERTDGPSKRRFLPPLNYDDLNTVADTEIFNTTLVMPQVVEIYDYKEISSSYLLSQANAVVCCHCMCI